MKKDPVRTVGIMVYLLGIVVVILPFIRKGEDNLWILGLIFLFCSMCVVSAAIKHMAKRIDELEKKLETNQTEKAS